MDDVVGPEYGGGVLGSSSLSSPGDCVEEGPASEGWWTA
jgi:hypothetical protein